MKLNIKRFASSGDEEIFVDYNYDYTPNGYIHTVTAIITCYYDISSIFLVQDENEIDDTNNWIITEDSSGRSCAKRYFHKPFSAMYNIYCENNETPFSVNVDIINDFQPESEQFPVILNHDVKISDSNTKLKKVAEVVENYFDELYPIGSVYKTTNNEIPFSKGTWIKIAENPDRECIGSQIIHPGLSGSSLVSKTSLLGAYGTSLYSNIFNHINIPIGYHKEYRLTFQATCGGNTKIQLFLNNISTDQGGTWSANTYRVFSSSDFFKESDIVLENTYGYSNPGTNLKYAVTGSASAWQFWNVTVHGYLVSNEIWYTWERTA